MVHVALLFGERPEVAYVLPISVDGMLVVASTAMMEDKRHDRRVRLSARLAFIAGVAASMAANIAAAHPSVGARIVAAWPALAMLLVVEILSRNHPAALHETPGHRADAEISAAIPRTAGQQPEVVTESGIAGQRRHGNEHERPRRNGGGATDIVRRLHAENPSASMADIAAQVGVSERHVRRLLTTRQGPAEEPTTVPSRAGR